MKYQRVPNSDLFNIDCLNSYLFAIIPTFILKNYITTLMIKILETRKILRYIHYDLSIKRGTAMLDHHQVYEESLKSIIINVTSSIGYHIGKLHCVLN